MDIESIFEAAAKKLRIDFELLTPQIRHNGSKGRVREADLIEGFLRPYLPDNVAIAHGAEIASVDGTRSGECDIVIYDANSLSFMDASAYKIIPIESVYMVIEIKSFLSKTELQKSVDNIRTIKKMNKIAYRRSDGRAYLNTVTNDEEYIGSTTSVYGEKWPYFPTLAFIFSYDSHGLNSVLRNLEEMERDSLIQHKVDGIWVLKKGNILNWSDDKNQLTYALEPQGRRFVDSPGNPLLSMLVILHTWCLNAWMPPFELLAYFQQASLLTDEVANKLRGSAKPDREKSATMSLMFDGSRRVEGTTMSGIVNPWSIGSIANRQNDSDP